MPKQITKGGVVQLHKDGRSLIDIWLSQQSDDDKEKFWRFANSSRHSPSIQQYLNFRGCEVGRTATYNWVRDNVKEGAEAAKLNRDLGNYVGIELRPFLERMLVTCSNHLNRFETTLNQADMSGELGVGNLQTILSSYPAVIREIRSLIEAIHKHKSVLDEEALKMEGADLLRHAILNAETIKDTSEETWIRTTVLACYQDVADKVRAA